MAIFILRVSDGSFFICEADDPDHARALVECGETVPLDPRTEEIVSVRPMERNTLMSRWYFDDRDARMEDESDIAFGTPEGMLDAQVSQDILEHEFPAIAEAERITAETPIGDPSLPPETPFGDPRNLAAMDAMEKRWRRMLRDAIRSEQRRFEKRSH